MKKIILKVVFITLGVLMFQLNGYSAYSEVEAIANNFNDYSEQSQNVTVDGNIDYEIDVYASAVLFRDGYGYAHGEVRVAGGFLICQRFAESNNSAYVTGTHIAQGSNTYTISALAYIDAPAYASARVRISW